MATAPENGREEEMAETESQAPIMVHGSALGDRNSENDLGFWDSRGTTPRALAPCTHPPRILKWRPCADWTPSKPAASALTR
jgi:hypothetical protein